MDPALDVEAVVHQLAEEVLLCRRCPGTRRPPARPRRTGRAAARSGPRRDGQPVVAIRPLPYGLQQLAVDARLVVVALRGWPASDSRNRLCMPPVVLGEQRHVGVGAAAGDVVAPPLVAPAGPGCWSRAVGAGREVGLDADDRLDPGRCGLLPELVGAEDVAVVGHRERRHAHPRGLGEQVVEPGRAVEHRVLGVHVQVDERVGALRRTSRSAVVGRRERSACRAATSRRRPRSARATPLGVSAARVAPTDGPPRHGRRRRRQAGQS